MTSVAIRGWTDEIVLGGVDMTSWTKLTYLDTSFAYFSSMPVFPSTLTHLEAGGVRVIRVDEDEFDPNQKAVFPFPNLEYLSVEDSELFSVINDMANPALTSNSLKTLKVGSDNGCIHTNSRNDWSKTLPAPSATLETISLHERFELSEESIIAVLRQYPNLKCVDLGRTEITGSTLRELFDRENKPEFINLGHCMSVYYDAVEAARAAGIEVSHNLAPKNKKMESRWRDKCYG